MATILFDCDDVLLNWAAGYRKYLLEHHGVSTNGERPASWNMQAWTGLDKARIGSTIGHFNEQTEAFGELEPVPGAVEGIRKLSAEGHELVVITSCSDEVACIERREWNLINEFGDVFSELTCLPRHISKFDALAKYAPSLWVEDNFDNACVGLEVGHRSMMLEYPHNLNFKPTSPEGIVWHAGWGELMLGIERDLSVGSPAPS